MSDDNSNEVQIGSICVYTPPEDDPEHRVYAGRAVIVRDIADRGQRRIRVDDDINSADEADGWRWSAWVFPSELRVITAKPE